jgi:hypothetical protein
MDINVNAPKQVYLAGPMRGYAQFNFPAFFAAGDRLEKEGWRVWNPAKKDEEQYGDKLWKDNKTGDEKEASANTGFSLRDALRWDTDKICGCDAIAMLPGWEKSNGAKAEWALAVALGLEVMYL